jgi:hypothetical protein
MKKGPKKSRTQRMLRRSVLPTARAWVTCVNLLGFLVFGQVGFQTNAFIANASAA